MSVHVSQFVDLWPLLTEQAFRWYPEADWETLQTLSYFFIWLFLWDDTIDTAEYDISDDLDRANRFRDDTITVFEQNFLQIRDRRKEVEVDGINRVVEAFSLRVTNFFTTGMPIHFTFPHIPLLSTAIQV